MDMSLLPRCRASLDVHAQRVNYQAYIWCYAHTNSFQTYQVLMVMAGKLMKKVPLITNGLVVFIVPQKLIDILCVKPSETSKDVEEGTRIWPQKQIT